jgi:hypothetical protein
MVAPAKALREIVMRLALIAPAKESGGKTGKN